MIELLRPRMAVFAIQIYWITLVFIGWTLVSMLLRLTKGSFVHDWQRLPIAAKFTIAVASGFLLFSIFTVIGYSLSLPAWWLGAFYIASLLGAGTYAYLYNRPSIIPSVLSLLGKIKDIRLVSPLGIMVVLVVLDLLVTFFIGGFIGGDGFIHVSKIRHLAENGFSLTDAYYGTVPETRHTISVLHTLMAIPSWFGINPLSSWYASAMFFKLVRTAAIFYLAWRFLYWVQGTLRIQCTALVVILSLALFSNYFISYPSIFVATWVMLFTVALLDMTRGHNLWLLVIASTLIAVTHPLASLACALLLAFVTAALLLFERRLFTIKVFMVIILSFLLLLSTPLFTATLPNRMTDSVKNFAASGFSYFQLGSRQAFRPEPSQYFTADSFTAMPWPIWLLSSLGIIGLFALIQDRRYRIIIGAIILYVPITLYDPLLFSLFKKHLPVWAIARFTVANQLTIVMAFFGLLLLCFAANKLSKHKIKADIFLAVLSLSTLLIFACMQSFGALDPKAARNTSMYGWQKSTYNDLQDIMQILPNDKNAIVLAERTTDSFMIPVVASLRVVAIHEANSSPAADMTHRSLCFAALYTTLDPALMKQAHVSYVLAKRSETTFYNLALQRPTLRVVKENDSRVLFKFDGTSIEPAHEPACYFNE